MTQTITPFASVADLAWIPVLTGDGNRTRVGLREALAPGLRT
jgi:hypothetical protein